MIARSITTSGRRNSRPRHDREQQEHDGDREDDRSSAEHRDENKPGQEGAEDASRSRPGVDPADDAAGLPEVGEGQFDYDGADHSEHETRQQEQEDVGQQVLKVGRYRPVGHGIKDPGRKRKNQHGERRAGQQDRGEDVVRGSAISEPPAQVVSDGNPGKYNADDAGPGIEVHAQPGSHKASGHQFQHESGSAGRESHSAGLPYSPAGTAGAGLGHITGRCGCG